MYESKPESEKRTARYPRYQDVIDEVAAEIRKCRKPLHPDMPRDYELGAKWILSLIERPSRTDKPIEQTTRQGEAAHFIWPYLSHAKTCANVFLHSERLHQDYIIAAKEDGIPWRGEGHDIFVGLVNQYIEMRGNGLAAFRKNAAEKRKELSRRFQSPKRQKQEVA